MAERSRTFLDRQQNLLRLLLAFFSIIGATSSDGTEVLRRYERVRFRSERLLASVSADAAPSPLPLSSSSASSRVYHVTDYGADPTGKIDSTAAILRALSDAFRPPSNRSLITGITDLGGAELNLDGGSYLISSPIALPSSPAGNLKIHSGSLRASNNFPTNRYLIELWPSQSTSSYNYEYITLSSLMLDANYRAGGIAIVNSLRTLIQSCYIVHFASDGIWVQDGHETLISASFLGQHITAGADPGERSFSGTAIRIDGNDNSITDIVIFSAAVGIQIAGQANIITGVHCYNKATGFGGTGIYLKLPGLTQTRIVNCYLDYTGIVAEDPVQLYVSGSFFLGDANVVLKSVNGVIKAVDIVDNMFAGGGGVDIVRLDETGGAFTSIDQVVVKRNSVNGMAVRSTAARASLRANGTIWTIDFSPVLLFPNRIDHVQYAMITSSGFPNHALRNVSANRVVIESDVAVQATVHVEVEQCQGSMA
ncbi:polygalacturonase QRT3 [Dendrobium catenatum]|uniref:Polygalacturonase QRT3 n=1 Tax=Dendrobium catenatum TaxID=906689 RepID=A0A2I0WMD9_9ASPA|nr:polygalacturonase QRT3 [Dendrobium catenatum]PKU76816.1 Polygalacturonase QRT3 [Dendrobium catenatum]